MGLQHRQPLCKLWCFWKDDVRQLFSVPTPNSSFHLPRPGLQLWKAGGEVQGAGSRVFARLFDFGNEHRKRTFTPM